ncbi:MAG: hypothetical protein WC201_00780 [Bacilli bacterium]
MIKKTMMFAAIAILISNLIVINNCNLVIKPSNEQKISENKSEYTEEGIINSDSNATLVTNTDETQMNNKIIADTINLFSKNENSVEDELTKMIANYDNKIAILEKNKTTELDIEEIENMSNLVLTLKQMIADYDDYETSNLLFNNSAKSITAKRVVVSITPDLPLLAAHAAIVSYFSDNDYTLAAELLTHMRSNSSYDSEYRPVNSNIVRTNSIFTNLSDASKPSIGTDEFPNSNSTIEQDLHLSINKFNYSKSLNNTAIVLTDRYDFAYNDSYDDFVTQTAVNLMYEAQEEGLLTPFYVVVEYANTIYISNNTYEENFTIDSWKYSEKTITLGRGECIIYNLFFPNNGYRNIQTFGYNNSYLELFNSNGYCINSNNDDGYKSNAFIKNYFFANQIYKLKVKLYYNLRVGNIRTAITSSNDSNFDNISEIERTSNFLETYYKNIEINISQGTVFLFTLKPALKSNYIITTAKKGDTYIDTYLYLIDPRRSDIDRTNIHKSDELKSTRCDDDSGDNWQAKISVNHHATDIPYLIIVSTYYFNGLGNFYLKISGMNTSHFVIL